MPLENLLILGLFLGWNRLTPLPSSASSRPPPPELPLLSPRRSLGLSTSGSSHHGNRQSLRQTHSLLSWKENSQTLPDLTFPGGTRLTGEVSLPQTPSRDPRGSPRIFAREGISRLNLSWLVFQITGQGGHGAPPKAHSQFLERGLASGPPAQALIR